MDEIEVENLLNMKVEWIASKQKEQIFSYIIKQHIKKYKETPFFNEDHIQTKSYSEDIEKNINILFIKIRVSNKTL